MKLFIQRVSKASVCVETQVIGQIDAGLMVLVGFGQEDTSDKLVRAADKLLNLRIFSDTKGRFQYSVLDLRKDILLVPQFTLYANTAAGRRPSFIGALKPQLAAQLFDQFYALVADFDINRVEQGRFGADMQVTLINDGPVSLMIDV